MTTATPPPPPTTASWTSVPLSAAAERTLTADVLAEKTARAVERIEGPDWHILEDDWQALVTAAARVPGTEELWLEHFFGAPVTCPACAAATELVWCSRVVDWYVRCTDPGCTHHDMPLLSVEAKPEGAAGQWGRATIGMYDTGVRASVLIPQPGFVVPPVQCTPTTCPGATCQAAHTVGDAGGYLAAPQVLGAALLGSAGTPIPVVVLTDAKRGDATKLYGSLAFDFAIDPSAVRTAVIADRLTAVCAALTTVRPAMSAADADVTGHAVAAVWARLPGGPWGAALTSPVGSWLPTYAHAAAAREQALW
ncbi:hypothetical protein ACI78Q_00220 [Geodermatophilus sp. SYSU D00705]